MYNETTQTDQWWSELFGTPVHASTPCRIGEGQVGMNLRYQLDSSDPGVPQSVVVKLASPDSISRATGVALRNYEREAKFYDELVDSVDVRTPACYFTDWDEASGDVVIVLEDMAPAEQGDQIRGCEIDHARLAVSELTRLHGPRWDDPTLWDISWLQRRTGQEDAIRLQSMYSMFLPGFLTAYGQELDRQTDGRGVDFVKQLSGKIVSYVAARDAPFTVTHGDYRLDNLLFATASGGVACCVVDWQTPGHGNGVADLAYFIGAGLLPDDRRKHEWDLVDRYIAGIESYGRSIRRDWIETHYRREAISGVVMAVIASQIVGRTDRGDLMFTAMGVRHCLQAIDNGAMDLL